MSYHIPSRKAEQSFKAWMGTITGLAVRTRFSGAEKSLPELVITCDSCDPIIRLENNLVGEWACDLKFTIRTRYIKGDPVEGEGHDVFVGAVLDMLQSTDVVSGINQYSELLDSTAILWRPGGIKERVNDKDLETELSGMLWIVPSAT